jgi:hypothetical protein
VPVQEAEYRVILGLDLEPVELHLSERAKVVLSLNTGDRALRDEISRLVAMIKQDVATAGSIRTGVNPMRFAPNDSDVFSMLMQRWEAQDGMCALCDRPIPLKPENKLLQMSRDRSDSLNKTYDWQNTCLTHLACNLGKSDATVDQWRDYLTLIRSS